MPSFTVLTAGATVTNPHEDRIDKSRASRLVDPAMESPFRKHWSLDPEVTFLNHGSFGATPRVVMDFQQTLRAEMEREPVQFLWRHLPDRLDRAREALARFVGGSAEGLAFVTNATAAISAVLRSATLKPGDEILTTDHAYNASRCALEEAAARTGATLVMARIPFPIESEDQAADAIVAAVTSRTRLALIDHVTSPTALVLPIERIVRDLEARGVETLVDGAHAPGMVDLDIAAMRPSWYTGNLHKWVCAPKGAAFLWTREDRREGTLPPVISHGWNTHREGSTRYHDFFDWTGTFDPTAWLSVPQAIRFLDELHPDGWPGIRRDNRDKVVTARRWLADELSVRPPCPESMLGSMASLPLPEEPREGPPMPVDPIQFSWFDDHRIEMPVMTRCGRRWFRFSAHLYNDAADFVRVVDAFR